MNKNEQKIPVLRHAVQINIWNFKFFLYSDFLEMPAIVLIMQV